MVNPISTRASEICAFPSDPPNDCDALARAALRAARSSLPSGGTIDTSFKGA